MRLFRRTPSFEALLADLQSELEAASPGVTVERQDEVLTIAGLGSTEPLIVAPRGFAHRVLRLPERERRSAVSRIARTLVSGRPEGGFDELAPRLVPAVRSWSWTASAAGSTVSRPVVPFVEAAVAIDDEVTMDLLTSCDLETWGVPWDRVWERAMANVDPATWELVPVEGYAGIAAISGPEAYTSTCLLFPDRLSELTRRLPGEADRLVMAPTRDHVYAASADDVDGLRTLLDLGEKLLRQDPRAISPVLYRLGDNGLTVWNPGTGHPVDPSVARNRAFLAATEYAAQQTMLEERFEAERRDAFVASLMVFDPHGDGRVSTGTTWSEGVNEGSIPKADFVVFAFEDGSDMSVAWRDVVQIGGDWLIRDDSAGLPRWTYTSLPEEDRLAALRRVAQPFSR